MTFSTRAELKKSTALSKATKAPKAPLKRRISRSVFAAIAVSAFAVATIAPAALALTNSIAEASGPAATSNESSLYDNAQLFKVSSEVVSAEVDRASYEAYKAPEPVIIPATAVDSAILSSPTDSLFTLRDLQFRGVINWSGMKFTYYSQSVLPGGGLQIPGRHVNSAGFVSDGDGYIVIANSAPLGTVISTPFGYAGKVYDRGTAGNHMDVYTR